jgi:hypothetical protein
LVWSCPNTASSRCWEELRDRPLATKPCAHHWYVSPV